MKTDDISDDIICFGRSLIPTDGNNNKQKLALYVTIIIVLGVMFDFVQIDSEPKRYVWEAIKVGLGALGVHIWNKERQLISNDSDDGEG